MLLATPETIRVQKYNPYHDPRTGRFTSRSGGASLSSKVLPGDANTVKTWPTETKTTGNTRAFGEEALRDSQQGSSVITARNAEGKLVGIASLRETATADHEVIEIKRLATHPPGQGTGKALVQEAARQASRKKLGLATVAQWQSDPFYRHLGFKWDSQEEYLQLSPSEARGLAGR